MIILCGCLTAGCQSPYPSAGRYALANQNHEAPPQIVNQPSPVASFPELTQDQQHSNDAAATAHIDSVGQPVTDGASSDAELLELIETTKDPVIRRVLTGRLSSHSLGQGTADDPPMTVVPQDDPNDVLATTQTPQGPMSATLDSDAKRQEPNSAVEDDAADGGSFVVDDSHVSEGQSTKMAVEQVPIAQVEFSDEDALSWNELLDEAIRALQRDLDEGSKKEDRDDHLTTKQESLLRLMQLVADEREAAVRPIKQLDPAERDFWNELLYGLMVYFNDQEMPVAKRRTTLALQHFRRAVDFMSEISDLEVRNVVFCTRVDSYGRFTKFDNYEFRPDQEVLLYVEVDNFAAEQQTASGDYETALQGSYEIRDLAQKRVAEHSFLIEKEICHNRRRDFFIPYRMYVPKINPGQYTLQVTIQDVKSKKIGQSVPLEFTIKQ